MTDRWWIVELDMGGVTWQPIAYCANYEQADNLAKAAHIEAFGKPARVREYGMPAGLSAGKQEEIS